ncbi:P-loop containing nucleoside triphosphate hydrolase protein [Sanghuangporus baumii]|uniref:P-loop containing nucleoside triphosphate hydrolase protein n=1 Tax=Sanghuangporus baumii TaxID=108892 RepID=A0A9Q5HQN0_SANBA|nr:P-loop containing nucleoside triphosphate hydrolase protein [Sanghuangporus baumii]
MNNPRQLGRTGGAITRRARYLIKSAMLISPKHSDLGPELVLRRPADGEWCVVVVDAEDEMNQAKANNNFLTRHTLQNLLHKPDMLNTELIESASGRPKYTILTRASYILGKDNTITDIASRNTRILNELGTAVVEIEWTGREKKSGGLIRVTNSGPIKLPDLFGGCESIDASSDTLSIPTRLGYHWIATRHSLIACNPDTREIVARFHERCVQLGDTLSPFPIPKVGSDYLEFEDLPETAIAELLVGFIFVNIMRRTRFDLPRYHFPLVDGCETEPTCLLYFVQTTSIGILPRSSMLGVYRPPGDMDMDQLDPNSNLFEADGLLEDFCTQEETLVEDSANVKLDVVLGRDAGWLQKSRESTFMSNGLLEDAGDLVDVPSTCTLQDSQTSSSLGKDSSFSVETTTCNEEIVRIDDGGLKSLMLEVANGTFASTGLLDDSEKSNTACGHEEALAGSQDELPSLSQILHPCGRAGDELPKPREPQLSSASVLSSSIAATMFDGKTMTFRRKVKSKSRTATERQHFGNLLERPIHRLKDQLSEITATKLRKSEAEPSSSTALKLVSNELWVDRYRPARFIDLLGDERVHRDTLAWLKEWDFCVFGKRKALGRQSKAPANQNSNLENRYEDVYYRPREKILLLAGPAGYGKTTLAHVVARQAGYEVMEINASDSRSGQVIDDRIRPTLESGSGVGSKKPVCLVLDEIDGATGAGENSSTFIHKLIGLTFDNARKKGRKDKNKDTKRPLLRPIICICNDLYASSLTKLRQYARIVRFTRPADIHLTKRLKSICEMEGLRTESRALTTLVGIAKGDMRGCLNTLQFIKARQQEVTEPIIRSATVGMKEGDSSFSSVLNGLFAPVPRKRVKELGMTELEENRYVSRLSADIDATGSVDKVALGCFEHYANLRHYEASLSRHEAAASWLVAFDSLSTAMRSEREYGLMPYLSYTLVPFFPLFNERGGPKVDRPKADWDALMKTRTNEEIYKSLAKCVQSASGQRCAGLRHFLSNEIMELELAPYLNRIISPPMRPINRQVTKPQERALLSRLVDIMVSLDLCFIQEKAEDGQLIYRLEPPIDAFITYDGKRATDIAVQRYATRHVVAGEIDAQVIARHAEIVGRGKTKTFDMFKTSKNDNDNSTYAPKASTGLYQSGKRKSETVDIADKPPVDFFGRPIALTAAPSSKRRKGITASVDGIGTAKFKVSYRFNEGNSAAVRKPVKVSSFL